MAESGGVVRLAELVATLSLATDLGRGQPMEHCVRKTAIALRIAEHLGLDEDERAATYYVGLLDSVYCHADAYEQVQWFGDDIGFKADVYEADARSIQALVLGIRRVGSAETGLARLRRIAAFPLRGAREAEEFLRTHTQLQESFARALGLGDPVAEALLQSYERWDGKGWPNGLRGDEISLPARISPLADLVEVSHRRGGVDAARELARERGGGHLDPELSELFRSHAEEFLGEGGSSSWASVLDVEPGLWATVGNDELDSVLEAIGDLIDMKSPYLAGHSRGVANLAAEAAAVSGLADEDRVAVRRAGFLHDIGRLGISNAIWDKPAPLTGSELERVRLHPYLTDRMLAGVPALRSVRTIAARHHERIDGSGYPGGLTGAELAPAERLLAAADAYHAMTEPRPHREALDPELAAAELRREAKAGRLDADAVDAVLRAAGHRAPARRDWPAGLTAREVEVLRLLARGQTNKQIAEELVITAKTVSSHVEHIYRKIDVTSRAGATLFATRQGLMSSFEALEPTASSN